MFSKIKTIFVKNKLAVSLSVVLLVSFVALFFLLQRPAPIDEVNETDQMIEEEKPEEAIKETDTEILSQVSLDDQSFSEKAIPLNTSEKLLAYLNEHYLGKDAREVSVFGKKVLSFHGFQAVIVRYQTIEGFINTVLVFRDGDTPRYIAVTNEGIKMFAHGWSFEDLFNAEERRLNTKIVRFAIRPLDVFKAPEWEER